MAEGLMLSAYPMMFLWKAFHNQVLLSWNPFTVISLVSGSHRALLNNT